jgi:hypothetical protein
VSRRLGAVVFHWFGVPPGRIGQASSAWPAALPPRSKWSGVEFWLREEKHLTRAGVDFEVLQLTSARWWPKIVEHLQVVERPCGLQVGEEAMPWPANEPTRPLEPRDVADPIVEAVWLLRETGVPFELVHGRLLVHLWHCSGERQVTARWYEQLRLDVISRAGIGLHLICHPAWPRLPDGPDETLRVFGAGHYLDHGGGRSAAIRPGFLQSHKPEVAQLPREGGRHYIEAWRDIVAAAPVTDRVLVVWNEIEEGSQIRPTMPTHHEPDDPLNPWGWESAAANLPVLARHVSAPDWWGHGRRRYMKLTRRWSRRWKEAQG